jgi:integrase
MWDRSGKKAVERPARLLLQRNGGAIYRTNWSVPWAKAAKKVGLPKGFGLHSLRHFFATTLIHAGASVVTVQKVLGHATVTLNVYIHEWPDAIDRTRNLVDAALGAPLTGSRKEGAN